MSDEEVRDIPTKEAGWGPLPSGMEVKAQSLRERRKRLLLDCLEFISYPDFERHDGGAASA
jgi:hypothetical protein